MMYETSPEPNWVLLLPVLKVVWNQDPCVLGGPQGSQLKSAEWIYIIIYIITYICIHLRMIQSITKLYVNIILRMQKIVDKLVACHFPRKNNQARCIADDGATNRDVRFHGVVIRLLVCLGPPISPPPRDCNLKEILPLMNLNPKKT